MNYIGESVAIGIVTMDDEGYDQMMVLHGTVQNRDTVLFFESDGHEPFEMSENWLKKLKPVVEEMGEQFQGANYCLIVGTISNNN